MTVINYLIIIVKNLITYDNSFPIIPWIFISEIQVKVVKDITIA